MTEGNSGTTTLTFIVSMNNPVDTAVSMTANTANVISYGGQRLYGGIGGDGHLCGQQHDRSDGECDG